MQLLQSLEELRQMLAQWLLEPLESKDGGPEPFLMIELQLGRWT